MNQNTARRRRGAAIYEAGGVEFVGHENGAQVFRVQSQSRPGLTHTVRLSGEVSAECDCEDFKMVQNTLFWARKKGTLDKIRGLPVYGTQVRCKHVWAARAERNVGRYTS